MMLRSFFAIPALVAPLLLAVPACGDDDPKTTADTADTAQPDTADTTEPDVAPDATADTTPDTTSTCTKTGFTAVAQDAGPFLGAFTYIAQSTLSSPVDTLNIELVEGQGGAAAVGTYALTTDGYESCANCVLIWAGCDENLANCAKTYLAQEGSLAITAFGTETGDKFTGTLTDVVLKEVTLDGDFKSTVVANGETWCLDSYAFDVTVQ